MMMCFGNRTWTSTEKNRKIQSSIGSFHNQKWETWRACCWHTRDNERGFFFLRTLVKTSVYLLLIPIYFLLSPLALLYKFLYSILQIAGQSRLQGNEKCYIPKCWPSNLNLLQCSLYCCGAVCQWHLFPLI